MQLYEKELLTENSYLHIYGSISYSQFLKSSFQMGVGLLFFGSSMSSFILLIFEPFILKCKSYLFFMGWSQLCACILGLCPLLKNTFMYLCIYICLFNLLWPPVETSILFGRAKFSAFLTYWRWNLYFIWPCQIFSLNNFSQYLFSLDAGCIVPVSMLSSLPLLQYVAGHFLVPSLLLLR